MIEKWLAIAGYEGIYEVSNLGRIRRIAPYRRRDGRPIVISPGKNRKGYLHVTLSRDNKKKTYDIHRLVASAFIGEPTSDKPHVNHKDGNKTNNRLKNLEWVTYKENMRHGDEILNTFPFRGEAHPMAKITQKDANKIRELRASNISAVNIANKFGITVSYVYCILRGEFW